ncbi:MAG: YtxH domain-containing protein [Candidatus Dojkabacteria bacterium]|nr:MAG: YtxH domain-containing protein [Candidatus Dojkabacteria bacterium]
MSGKSFVKGLLAGAAVGAAVGLLTAPKSGKELRKDLADYAKKMSKDVEKMLAKAKTVSKETYAKAVEEVTAMYAKVKSFDKADMDALKKKLMGEWESVVKKLKK